METTAKKMRSHLSAMAAAPESEPETLSLSPSPPPRVAFNLSSMVVKLPASSGIDDHRVSSPLRDFGSRDSAGDRRWGSSPPHRRRSPEGFGRRVFQRNRSPLDFHLRSSRLRNDAVAKFPGLGPSLLLRKKGFH